MSIRLGNASSPKSTLLNVCAVSGRAVIDMISLDVSPRQMGSCVVAHHAENDALPHIERRRKGDELKGGDRHIERLWRSVSLEAQ